MVPRGKGIWVVGIYCIFTHNTCNLSHTRPDEIMHVLMDCLSTCCACQTVLPNFYPEYAELTVTSMLNANIAS